MGRAGGPPFLPTGTAGAAAPIGGKAFIWLSRFGFSS